MRKDVSMKGNYTPVFIMSQCKNNNKPLASKAMHKVVNKDIWAISATKPYVEHW